MWEAQTKAEAEKVWEALPEVEAKKVWESQTEGLGASLRSRCKSVGGPRIVGSPGS